MSTFAAARGIKRKVARLNITGFDAVRVVLASILLVAATMKAQQWVSELIRNHNVWTCSFPAVATCLLAVRPDI